MRTTITTSLVVLSFVDRTFVFWLVLFYPFISCLCHHNSCFLLVLFTNSPVNIPPIVAGDVRYMLTLELGRSVYTCLCTDTLDLKLALARITASYMYNNSLKKNPF